MTTQDEISWNLFFPVFMDRLGTLMRRNMTKIVAPHGLTSAHAVYLMALKLQDGQTMIGLSRFLDLDPANTNRVVKTLKEKNFVYDDRKNEKSKKYQIFLTETGKDLATEIMNCNSEKMDEYFIGIPKESIIHVKNTMKEVLYNMDPELSRFVKYEYDDSYFSHLHSMPTNRDFVLIPKDKDGKNDLFRTDDE
jgi:MarR family.